MPLDELVYYRLGLPEDCIHRGLADALAPGFSFDADVFRLARPYRINVGLILYAAARELNAEIREGQAGSAECWTSQHLGRFLLYHTGEGWEQEESAIHWNVRNIGELVCLLKKSDGYVHDNDPHRLEGVDAQGIFFYRKGVIFLYDTNDNEETFFDRFNRFFSVFHRAISQVCRRHNTRCELSIADQRRVQNP